jgi:hypothetical protein
MQHLIGAIYYAISHYKRMALIGGCRISIYHKTIKMKKAIFSAMIGLTILTMISCSNNAETKTHTHDDGSTHAEHDTTKPAQHEFVVGDTTSKDTTTKQHTHEDGEKHSH